MYAILFEVLQNILQHFGEHVRPSFCPGNPKYAQLYSNLDSGEARSSIPVSLALPFHLNNFLPLGNNVLGHCPAAE